MRPENERPTVSIWCLVYNHEPYLRQCLEGFVMQKTNFRVEAIVHDDVSTDNSAAIIREYAEKYPDLIKPIFETENQHSKHDGSLDKIMTDACDGKYVAKCEGDDYWTDPLKLQKQVDFLEEHPDCSLCFHKVEVLSNRDTDRTLYDHLEAKEYTAREIYDVWTVPTCSEMHRNGYTFPPIPKGIIYGDIYSYLNYAQKGKLYCLDFVGGVYRRLESGMSSTATPSMYIKLLGQYRVMMDLFPDLQDITLRNIEYYRNELAATHVFDGSYKYRFQKMRKNPRLLYRPYMLKTIFWHVLKLKKDIIVEI